MLSTVQVFDLIKSKQNIESDYELAKRLSVSGAIICKHRKKTFGMSNELALKCAPLAGIPAELLLLWSSAERAKCTQESEIFRRVAAWLEIRKDTLEPGFLPHPNGKDRLPERRP